MSPVRRRQFKRTFSTDLIFTGCNHDEEAEDLYSATPMRELLKAQGPSAVGVGSQKQSAVNLGSSNRRKATLSQEIREIINDSQGPNAISDAFQEERNVVNRGPTNKDNATLNDEIEAIINDRNQLQDGETMKEAPQSRNWSLKTNDALREELSELCSGSIWGTEGPQHETPSRGYISALDVSRQHEHQSHSSDPEQQEDFQDSRPEYPDAPFTVPADQDPRDPTHPWNNLQSLRRGFESVSKKNKRLRRKNKSLKARISELEQQESSTHRDEDVFRRLEGLKALEERLVVLEKRHRELKGHSRPKR